MKHSGHVHSGSLPRPLPHASDCAPLRGSRCFGCGSRWSAVLEVVRRPKADECVGPSRSQLVERGRLLSSGRCLEGYHQP